MDAYEELLLERREDIGFLTLDRPDKGNALNATLLESISAVLRDLEGEGVTRCVVVRGSGEKGFSVGMDLHEMAASTAEENLALIGAGGPLRRALDSIESFPFPVIAMIRGYAAGAACELAMACDIRVGGGSSRMGMPPARLGVVYPPEGLRRFVRTVGLSCTRNLFLAARYFDAGESLRMGMLDYLVPDEELETFTVELAQTVAENAPLSQAGHKRSLRILEDHGWLDSAGRAEIDSLMDGAMRSEDAAEALRAFSEKRRPHFEGK